MITRIGKRGDSRNTHLLRSTFHPSPFRRHSTSSPWIYYEWNPSVKNLYRENEHKVNRPLKVCHVMNERTLNTRVEKFSFPSLTLLFRSLSDFRHSFRWPSLLVLHGDRPIKFYEGRVNQFPFPPFTRSL